MKLDSVGILVGIRPFNERDSVARIFTADYGLLGGMMRGGVIARKNKPLVGQVGAVSWNARLDTQLGVFHWESSRNLAAALMISPRLLGYMNAAFELIETMLPERESYGALYADTMDFLTQLATTAAPDECYMSWEMNLLRELGYALDLDACAGCGGHDNLDFISPRTYRAVCAKCGAPYADRLYKLPINLGTLRHLLNDICASVGAQLPPARARLEN